MNLVIQKFSDSRRNSAHVGISFVALLLGATLCYSADLLVLPIDEDDELIPRHRHYGVAMALDNSAAAGTDSVDAENHQSTSTDNQLQAVFGDVLEEFFGEMAAENSPSPRREMREARRSSTSPSRAAADNDAKASRLSKKKSIPVRKVPPHVLALRGRVRRCLNIYSPQILHTGKYSCWSVMHSFLAWGPNTRLALNSPRGRRVNALAWVATNQSCAGRQLFYLEDGKIVGREGPGYQGHPAQFLAMLAQIGVSPQSPMRIEGQEFVVADLIESEKLTCRSGMELTFKLIGLSYYLDSDETWTSDAGEAWSIPRLIREELAQPINGAACGGTHRIMGHSYAIANRQDEGKPLDGQWWRAAKFVSDYQRYALTLQNRDGSFSCDWFKGRADRDDIDRKIQTTGHILEWLVYSIPHESLYDPRIVRSVSFLTNLMISNRYHEWEIGPKFHAIRALRLYDQRVFQGRSTSSQSLVRLPMIKNQTAFSRMNSILRR